MNKINAMMVLTPITLIWNILHFNRFKHGLIKQNLESGLAILEIRIIIQGAKC